MTANRLTDVGNAARFAAAVEGRLKWVDPFGSFIAYEGGIWSKDAAGIAMEMGKKLSRIISDEARHLQGDERTAHLKWAIASESASRVQAAMLLARSDPRISIQPESLDADPNVLATANGVIDLTSGHLLEHSPDRLITKRTMAGYHQEAEAPIWEKFVATVLPDETVRLFVQRSLGAALVGQVVDHALWIAWGSGANGKSTLLGAVQEVMGDYAMTAAPELLLAGRDQHPTGLADLRGSRLVITSELEDGRRLAEGTVKSLTGGDKVKARYMRQDYFQFTPSWSLWVATNHRPQVRGTDLGIWRRIKLVPFTVTIAAEDQDPKLPIRLRDEAPGILAWLVRGCLAWAREGLNQPMAITLAVDDYRAAQDVLAGFLTDRCTVAETTTASAKELYLAYSHWCEENGERPGSQRRFGEALSERGMQQYRTKSERRWKGIGLGDAMTLVTGDPA